MLKRSLIVGLLMAGSAFAQQELAISGKDIESGAADAKLAALARQASTTGRPVVVNAPAIWHDKIAAKLRAAGASNIKLNDSFFENVVVRIEDKPAPKAEPAPTPAPAPAAAPAPTPKPVAAPAPKPVPAPAPKPEPKPAPAPAPKVEPTPAPTPAPPKPEPAPPKPEPAPVAMPAPAPVATPAPAPVAAAPAPKAPVDNTAAVRQRLEKSLNEGRPADGDIAPTDLQKGDVVYVDGGVRAVVRRERLHSRLFWLTGELELKRVELKPVGENRYEVSDKLAANAVLFSSPAAPSVFTAAVPADGDAERAQFQKQYAEGRAITRVFKREQLRSADLLYVGKSSAVVVRREGTDYLRGWLEGSVDLNQKGLQKDGSNKYKVISDNLK